jgi:hypothetical protein
MADLLRVKGLGKADGEYEFDFANLLSINGSESLTLRELHQIQQQTGLRGMEVREAAAFLAAGVMVELCSIILTRQGQQPNVQRLWDSKFIYSDNTVPPPDLDQYTRVVNWHLDGRVGEPDDEGEGEDSPPE